MTVISAAAGGAAVFAAGFVLGFAIGKRERLLKQFAAALAFGVVVVLIVSVVRGSIG
jgi:hypothetical protein